MDIIENIAIFIVGIYILVKAADVFVDQTVIIARKMKLSPLIIGLTIVALGTSLPEFAVSLSSAIQGGGLETAELSLGNIVGSNIANITLILGITALLSPIVIHQNIIKRDLPFTMIAAVLLFVFALFFQANRAIVWWEALIFVLFLVLYLVILIVSSRHERKEIVEELVEEIEEKEEKVSKFGVMTIVLLIIGILGIAVGAEMVTRPATYLAQKFALSLHVDPAMSTNLIGVSVVAVGTSLPELATSLSAAKKKQTGIVMGNLIGSNIVNVLFIVGISGLVVPLGISTTIIIDIIIMIAITGFASLLMVRKKISKVEGIILLLIFASYITYAIIRTMI